MTGAEEKCSFGFSVLADSNNGTKREMKCHAADDTGDEDDMADLSAAFKKENEVPVECPDEGHTSSSTSSSATSKKRKASPPKQSRVLSKEEIKAMYPNLCLDDEEDSNYEHEKPVQKKVRPLRYQLHLFLSLNTFPRTLMSILILPYINLGGQSHCTAEDTQYSQG